MLADQRQEFDELAANGAFDSYTVIQQPHREYQPSASLGGESIRLTNC